MKEGDEDDGEHKASLRKILEDFRRSLRDAFHDSLTDAETQVVSANKTATDSDSTSSGTVLSQTENRQSLDKSGTHAASQPALNRRRKPQHALSVLYDPRINRAITPFKDRQSVNNDHEQKMTNVGSQSLNNNNKQKMENVEDPCLNNDQQIMPLLEDLALNGDLTQKIAKLNDRMLNNDNKKKITSLDDPSSTNTIEAQRSGDNSFAKKSCDREGETTRSVPMVGPPYNQHSIEMDSPVEKSERQHVSDKDHTGDTRPAPRNTPCKATVENVASRPCQKSTSVCARNTDNFLNEECERFTSSSNISCDKDGGENVEHNSTKPSVMLKTSTDTSHPHDQQQFDDDCVTIEPRIVDGFMISASDRDTHITSKRCSLSDPGESPSRESVDTIVTPESEDTSSDDLPLYVGDIDSPIIVPSRMSASSDFTEHVYTDDGKSSTNYEDEKISLAQEKQTEYTVEGGVKDRGIQTSDSSDQTEYFTTYSSSYIGQVMPVTDDISIKEHGLNSEPGDENAGEISQTPIPLHVEHSIIPSVLTSSENTHADGHEEWIQSHHNINRTQSVSEDHGLEAHSEVGYTGSGDTANVENSDAQAQARAEQRKNSDVHLKFGRDGLHINTDNGGHFQQQITPPQQKLSPMPQQLTPLYDTQNGRRLTVEEANYHLNPYPTTYTTSLPEFSTNPVSINSYGYAPIFKDGSRYNGKNIEMPHLDNRMISYSSPDNHTHSSPYNEFEFQRYEHDRRRRLGRDHTNYVLPPSGLHLFKDKRVNSDSSLGGPGTDHGPPGLPLVSDDYIHREEAGLKLVVLDKTDDEDEFVNPSQYQTGDQSQVYGSSYMMRSHSDVFPIDRRAIDRDLYKQVFDPKAETNTSRSASVHTLGAIPNATNTFIVKGNNKQQEYNYLNNATSASGMHIHVTDYDSETGPETDRTSLGPNTPKEHQSIIGYSPNNNASNEHLHEFFSPPYNETTRTSQVNSAVRQLYSMSQVDCDRYTNNTSQLSVLREERLDLNTDRSPLLYKTRDNRGLIGIHPANQAMAHPETRVQGPGYKFQVNKYNVAKRASILNRAEQLLDARRGQFTDRSESSDELERIDEDDDEDVDRIDDMNGPRHRALMHLRRRVYDDSTSYNSSDDVLNNMRYQTRGPVTQAARRARLTSVNARLKKQKRSRATRRRQQIQQPSPPVSDDEDNSSETDMTEAPVSHRQLHDLNRYEEPNLPDAGKVDNLLNPNQGDTTPGPKGRRVMFYRNGDIHYKPKQVLINSKTYTNLEKLLVDLSSMVETSTGVKYIFSWPEGREVKSITELENGKYYVCSSTNKLQRVDYGNSKESHWKGGKIDRNDNFLFKQAAKLHSPLRRPRVLTVISNMKRDSQEKLILNTNSQMNFEDILNDISNMINIPNPPVKALYTEKKPHLKVESYSQLMRDFADEDRFIACGEEMLPLELTSRRPVPASDVRGLKKLPHKNLKPDPERFQEDPLTSRSNGGTNTRAQAKVSRRKADSVRVDINGKTREFYPPKQHEPNDDGQKPDKKLRLSWVYGYRGRDVKQNLAVLSSTGELVYFVAAVVVVYNKKFSSQKHYLGHSEEITCLAVHPNGRFIATGQTAGKTQTTGAHVRIWDGVSLSTLAVIGLGAFQQGVACVNFSERDVHVKGGIEWPSAGDLVMTVDDSERHVLSVWEWQTEKLMARTSTTNEPVVAGCFYAIDENILITYGKEHIHFWRMFWDRGGKIMRDKLSGNFQDKVPKYVTSICVAPNGDVISGDSSGAILVWTRDNSSVFALNMNVSAQTRKAHKKSVSALCMLGDGTLLSGGGNVVKAWDSINSYSLVKERVLPESAGHVRSIVPMKMGGLDGLIYVATTRNKVLEGSLQLKFTVIIQGHVEELWAVECHPSEETFVSAGHDQAVVKWSATSHVPVWRVNVENPCTSISIDHRGRLIAVGTTAGRVVILNSSSGVQVTSLTSGAAQINALSFSPDGKHLAVGTFDGLIHIFYVQDDGHTFFRPHASSLKHTGMFIMHLDWSIDSKLIQASMGDYEVVVWNVTSMQRIRSGSNLRDVKWAKHNSPISHAMIGPWQNLDSGDVINVVCRSQNTDLQVVGDTSGRLRLYRWPCSVAKAGYRQTKIYSSNVTCASFTNDDKYLIASGGNDAALMQFSVLDTANAR